VSLPIPCSFLTFSTDPAAKEQVTTIIQSHMTRKEPPIYGPVSAELVEYGIAQLRPDFHGKICEPLALVSCVRWFQGQEEHALGDSIRMRLAASDSRGAAFEELMILYITKTFRQPTRLDAAFDFHGTMPSWASQSAQLVCRVDENEFQPVDLDTATGMTYYASNGAEVMKWLKDSNAGWCLPGNLLGPDLLVRLQLSSGERILLVAQHKLPFPGNTDSDSLDAETATSAVTSLTSDHWFKNAVCSSSLVSILRLTCIPRLQMSVCN
jgi:hypothetical protein